MVWSNWRGAVVLMLVWVGLAWSQAPVPTNSVDTAERIMTVHENGKSLRCRVTKSWRTPEGPMAYELQVIDTGETMTIVEDGAASAVQDTHSSKIKAMPMRIFHWGRSGVAPSGAPTPSKGVVISTASSPCGCDVCATGNCKAPTRIAATRPTACPTCKPQEEVVWWEERNGARVTPMIVTEGKNPFSGQTVILPGSTAPGERDALTAGSSNGGVPIIVDEHGNRSGPSAPIVLGQGTPSCCTPGQVSTPGSTSTSSGAPLVSQPVVTLPGATPRMGTSAPAVRTVVQADPNGPSSKENVNRWSQLFTGPKVVATQPAQANVQPPSPTVSTSGPANVNPANTNHKTQGGYVQTGPTMLPNKVMSSTQPTQPSPFTTVQTPMPKTPGVAGGTTNPPKSGQVPPASTNVAQGPERTPDARYNSKQGKFRELDDGSGRNSCPATSAVVGSYKDHDN